MFNVKNSDLILFDQYSVRPGKKNFEIIFPTSFHDKYNGIIQFSVEPDLTNRSRLLVVKHQYKYDVSKTVWLSDGTAIVPYSTNKISGFARYLPEWSPYYLLINRPGFTHNSNNAVIFRKAGVKFLLSLQLLLCTSLFSWHKKILLKSQEDTTKNNNHRPCSNQAFFRRGKY